MTNNISITQTSVLIVGAGPAGISMGVEAANNGIDSDKILVVEKFPEHSWSIRKFYPDQKLVMATYKGQEPNCLGDMCIMDSSKNETSTFTPWKGFRGYVPENVPWCPVRTRGQDRHHHKYA